MGCNCRCCPFSFNWRIRFVSNDTRVSHCVERQVYRHVTPTLQMAYDFKLAFNDATIVYSMHCHGCYDLLNTLMQSTLRGSMVDWLASLLGNHATKKYIMRCNINRTVSRRAWSTWPTTLHQTWLTVFFKCWGPAHKAGRGLPLLCAEWTFSIVRFSGNRNLNKSSASSNADSSSAEFALIAC